MKTNDKYNYKYELQNKLLEYLNMITKADKKIKDHFICPLCSSGMGKNLTSAFAYKVDTKGIPRVTCFSCNQLQNSDIFDLIGKIEKLDNFVDQYNKALEIMGYNKSVKITNPIKENIIGSSQKLHDYTSFFLDAKKNIENTNYLLDRGISHDVLIKYDIGFIENWKHPKTNTMYPKSVIIIPINKYGYVARDTNINAKPDFKIMKVGTNAIFNLNTLYNSKRPVFIVEGEIDALSIITLGYNAIALGSVSNINKLISHFIINKPIIQLIITLDNDKIGIESTKKLVSELEKLKIPFITKNISNNCKDPNEALVKDKLLFSNSLKLAEEEAIKLVTVSQQESTKIVPQELVKEEVIKSVSETQLIKDVKNINISDNIFDEHTLTYKSTDLGNAERLIFHHGDIIRYCNEINNWYIYNGCYWQVDDTGEIYRKCWKIIRTYQNTANEAFSQIRKITIRGTERDNEEFQDIKAHKSFAKISENISRIKAMTETTGHFRYILQKELDRQNNLVSCNNGTIDLKIGDLIEHDPEHYISKKINIDFKEEAKSNIFESFLNKIFNNDTKLIEYIQIALGYTMTGETREQCFFICYGTGSNGKSTLFDIISYILADYTQNIPTAVLMDNNKKGSEASPELARAKGKRFVIASESKDLATLNENQIKAITGGDTISVRPLYGQGFEYKPTYKIWLGTNHKPVIKGTDNGIWRRVKMIPFNVTIPDEEQDKKLLDKLIAEREGILNWLVEGAYKYYSKGLPKNRTVDDATKEYREEMDTLSGFIDDCIKEKETSFIKNSDIYNCYSKWCEENGIEPIKQNIFGRKMSEKNYIQKRFSTARGYVDIELTNYAKKILQNNEFISLNNKGNLDVPKEFL